MTRLQIRNPQSMFRTPRSAFRACPMPLCRCLSAASPEDFLFDAIPTAPTGECPNLVAALAHVKEAALPELARRAESAAEIAEKARYAIVALHLGDPKPAADALAVRSDPIHRTTLIHAYASWHGDLTLNTRLPRNSRIGIGRNG